MRDGELARLLDGLCVEEGSRETAVAGLYLTRSSTTAIPRNSLDEAVFCVVAQGRKSTLCNGERLCYEPGRFLIVSLDLPLVGQVEEASVAVPYLGLSLVLDFAEIGSVMAQAGMQPEPEGAAQPGLGVGTMDAALLDAVVRLTRLLERPGEVAVMAPLVRREVYYRLLLSDCGGMLRRMLAQHVNVQRVSAGLRWLRANALRPIRMEELARELRMSQSGMHQWFRAVTAMSPLQFQKQLRLQEARRLMLAGPVDAAEAARRVGYESASQFSREYRRYFGAPPMRDIEELRRSGRATVRRYAAGAEDFVSGVVAGTGAETGSGFGTGFGDRLSA